MLIYLAMSEIKLKDYLKETNMPQWALADDLDITQGAISQMLAAKREIILILNGKGVPVSYYEIKKPRKRKVA